MSDPERARAAARRALSGDRDRGASTDERDEAEDARDAGEQLRRYLADRPPHHDRG